MSITFALKVPVEAYLLYRRLSREERKVVAEVLRTVFEEAVAKAAAREPITHEYIQLKIRELEERLEKLKKQVELL